MHRSPIKLAVLVSGSGTTLQNLIDRNVGDIRLVIGSRPGLLGLTRAESAGLASEPIDRRRFDTNGGFSDAVFDAVDRAEVDLVILAGWLCLLEVPRRYVGRVMNIHPSLLPAFGGRGMFGKKVHQAVLDRGCKVTGCTVHFVDDAYDTGPIILQRTCPVLDTDTADTLAARVFEQECKAYPEAIELFESGRLEIKGRTVCIGESNIK